MIWILCAIFGAVACGDFLLAVVIWLLLERREWRENAQIRKVLTGFPPDETPDNKWIKKARESAEAWARLQDYGVEDAYGGGSG